MRYITYDEAGNTTGAFLQDLHPSHAARHVECTEAQAGNWVNLKVVDGSLVASGASPPVYVPQEVTMRQARLALLGAGLLDSVEGALNSMPEGNAQQVLQKKAARIEWERSQAVQRNRGLTVSLAAQLGMNDAQIDHLFIQAATL